MMETSIFTNDTNDEINLICIYNGGSRRQTIAELREMRTYLLSDEVQLRDLTDSALAKLEAMTDAAFEELELYPDFL